MVGAAWWVATLTRAGHDPKRDDRAFTERVARDALTPVAQRLLFADIPLAFLPRAGVGSRGVALERAWSGNMGGALDVPFSRLAGGEAEGWRPSLVFTPMLVEDGRRLIVSNLYLPFLCQSDGPSLSPDHELPPDESALPGANPTRPEATSRKVRRPPGRPRKAAGAKGPPGREVKRYRYSLSAVEFFALFPDDGRFTLPTAARMSASFPWVSPAVDLPTTPRRRVVDAGYYDNTGVGAAVSWLYRHRDWLLGNTSGVVLIQVRDSAAESRRLYADAAGAGWRWSRGVEWLTGPLVGARSARESLTSFRNDEGLQRLADSFNAGGGGRFTTVVFECREEVALSWRLTRAEIDRVERNFEPAADPRTGERVEAANARALRRLAEWWGKQP
jgi:hypothetical protein